MKKNNFFSINRFALLLRNDFLLNYKKYLLTLLGTLIGMYVIIYFQLSPYASIDFPHYSNKLITGQYIVAFGICLIGLGVFLGQSFPAFSSKTNTQSYLLLPASTFEKYLSQVFIRIILGTLLFFLTFWLAAFLVRSTFLYFIEFREIKIFEFSDLFRYNLNSDTGKFIFYLIVVMFVSCGVYMFSVRLYFKKLAVLKTVISLAAAIFLSVLFFQLLAELTDAEFDIFEILLIGHYTNFEIWLLAMGYSVWLFFLPLAYFKLKEKQI